MTTNDFQCPECLSAGEETWFLNKSLEFEQQLLPGWFKSRSGEAKHRARFDSAIRSHKFCNVNATRVIQEDEGWRSFLSTLRPRG